MLHRFKQFTNIEPIPVQVMPSEFSSKPSEHRHLGPAFVLTHIWWQSMIKQGSINNKHKLCVCMCVCVYIYIRGLGGANKV